MGAEGSGTRSGGDANANLKFTTSGEAAFTRYSPQLYLKYRRRAGRIPPVAMFALSGR
jgi:hypothetical protein